MGFHGIFHGDLMAITLWLCQQFAIEAMAQSK